MFSKLERLLIAAQVHDRNEGPEYRTAPAASLPRRDGYPKDGSRGANIYIPEKASTRITRRMKLGLRYP